MKWQFALICWIIKVCLELAVNYAQCCKHQPYKKRPDKSKDKENENAFSHTEHNNNQTKNRCFQWSSQNNTTHLFFIILRFIFASQSQNNNLSLKANVF